MIVGSNNTFDALASEDAGAGRDLPDPADLPARVAADPRAPRRVPGQHPAADPGPDPGRPRPLADAALGARALAEPAQPVRRPRRPQATPREGPAGAARLPRRPRAGARQPRPVPRQPEPGDPLPRVPEDDGHRLPRRPRRGALRHATSRSPATRRRATACASSPTSGTEALAIYPSRLPTNRGNGYLQPGVAQRLQPRPRTGSSRTSTARTPTSPGAPRRRRRTPTRRRSAPAQTVEGSTTATRPAPTAAFRPLLHRRRLREPQRLPGGRDRRLRRRQVPGAVLGSLGTTPPRPPLPLE